MLLSASLAKLNLMPFTESILGRHKDVFHRTWFHKTLQEFHDIKAVKERDQADQRAAAYQGLASNPRVYSWILTLLAAC